MSNKKLAEGLHKSTIRKFEKRNLHLSFIDNIWAVDLAYMSFLSKFKFLLCIIDIYCKYAWVKIKYIY